MVIEQVDLNDEKVLNDFIKVQNKAFCNRKGLKNPYTPIDVEAFKKTLKGNEQMVVIKEDNQLVGGVVMLYREQELKICEVSHVCIDPDRQGKGFASQLLEYIHKKAQQDGYQIARLFVGAIWENAIGLYHKCGYEEIGIGAHLPGTYPLITLIKSLPPYSYPKMKRKWKYLIAKLKFDCLYYKGSTSRWLCKILFR